MSLINTAIKPFTAEALKNGKFITVSDADLKGKWSVVFFYPADFTFVCPTELEDLADNYAEFQKLGVEIYSVSTDTHFAHKAWHDTSEAVGKINYTMVGDPTGTITRNFDVMIEEVGLADRGTFVSIRKARSRSSRSPPAASAVTPWSCCARSRPPSTSPLTRAKSARPSGKKAKRL
jgi:peroxiredoxin